MISIIREDEEKTLITGELLYGWCGSKPWTDHLTDPQFGLFTQLRPVADLVQAIRTHLHMSTVVSNMPPQSSATFMIAKKGDRRIYELLVPSCECRSFNNYDHYVIGSACQAAATFLEQLTQSKPLMPTRDKIRETIEYVATKNAYVGQPQNKNFKSI